MPRTKVKTTVDSRGVRKRFDCETRDATEPLYLLLQSRDIAAAKKARPAYAVNDPENFVNCVAAKCLGRQMDASVAIMHRIALVKAADLPYTLRYEIAPDTAELIRANDAAQWENVPNGATIKLRPPCKSKRLASQRARASSKKRGSDKPEAERRAYRTDGLARAVQAIDWRDGKYVTDAMV